MAGIAAYRQAHKAERAAYYRTHKAEIIAQVKEYRRTHKTEIAAKKATYYQEHKAETIARTKAYYHIHKAERVAKKAAYQKGHKATRAARNAKRRALKHGSQIDGDAEAIKAVYARAASPDPIRCYLCGKVIPQGERHADHVIPLAHGGVHTSSNLAIAHAACNGSKHAKTPEEYRQYQLAAVA